MNAKPIVRAIIVFGDDVRTLHDPANDEWFTARAMLLLEEIRLAFGMTREAFGAVILSVLDEIDPDGAVPSPANAIPA